MKKADRYILLFLSAILLVFKFLIFGKVFADLNSYILPDDSFYSLLIAKNISLGKGFLYGENFTNGFQPLFVFLMVPVYLVLNPDIISPIYVSLFILTIFSLASLVIIYKLILLIFKNTYTAFIASLLFVITPVSLRNSTNGLETIISFFFFAVCFYFLYKYYNVPFADIPVGKYITFGIILGFAMLARIDNIFIFAGIFVYVLLKHKQLTMKSFVKYAFAFSLGFAVIYIPYLILSYHYTGSLYPVSGRSVRLQADFLMLTINSDKNYFVFMFRRFVRILGSNYLFILSVCFIISVYLFMRTRRKLFKDANLKEHLPVITVSLLFFFSYTFYIGAHWAFDRYFFPVFIPLIIFASFLIHKMYLSFAASRFKNLMIICFTAVIFFGNVMRPGIKGFLFDDSIDLQGYVKISKILNEELPKGSTIGAMQTGAMAYFSDNLKVVNLDGVVNPDAYMALRDKHLIEYIKKCKIDYLVLWDINYQLLAYASPALKAEDLTLVKIFDSVKSLGYNWYLYKVNY
jgi:hypothetical protein